jgi:DNA-binding protein YbaB
MTDGEDWRSRIAEEARRYQQLRERLAALSISVKSRDGAVRVAVSASGHLTGLELTESARAMSLADLAA